MPYINPNIRQLAEHSPATPGELNYAITMMALSFLEPREKNYTNYNAVIGALECAKLEFYRRMVTPYEEEKMKENGDVYLSR